ncbi:MAG: glycosyl transferase family 1 [Bacteroidetes bacterium]|nr:MAG: glycosyl transferase family 1 [Bacteroidota bacterium]
MKYRLAIVSTHPIQYNAPWFKLLAQEPLIELKVFYTWSQAGGGEKFDAGFNKMIEWDIPLLDGYHYEFVENTAKDPGIHHFNGIDNPDLNEKITNWQTNALLIFGWSFKSHLSCMRYFKNKIPVIFRGDSNLMDERPGIKRAIRRIFLKWVYKHVDFAFYAGTQNKRYFEKHGLDESQLVFVPHAIDNDRFMNGEKDHQSEAKRWRHSLGVQENDFLILFAGKLEEKKNPDYMLDLAAAIPEKHVKFLIVGNGPLEEELKARASHDNRILFVDFQNQKLMPVVYRLGDAFILPSKGPGESWGLAVNEAMSCGRPVIVSQRAGCAIDLVESGKNGFIMDPENTNGAVEYLYSLVKDHNKTRAAGCESIKLIEAFSYGKGLENISEFFQSRFEIQN